MQSARLKSFPLVRINVRLIEDASNRANRNLMLLRHDRRIHSHARTADKLDVASSLPGFRKTG